MKNKIVKGILIGFVSLLILVFVGAKIKRVTPLTWGHDEVNTPMFSDKAINGYDPVSYFTADKAIKGELSYTHNWNNAIWYFSSQENAELFKSNPEKICTAVRRLLCFRSGQRIHCQQ